MNSFLSSIAIFFTLASLSILHGETSSTAPDDQAIAEAVQSRLISSDEVRSSSVTARAADGVVTLTGRVDNLFASQQASRIAQNVKGTVSVVNQIQVMPGLVDDGDLEFFVKDALNWSTRADEDELSVTVNKGEVTLSGTAASLAEKKLAEVEVASVRGVKNITNDIKIKKEEVGGDANLESTIKDLLESSALLDNADVSVKVKEKTANLTGTVSTLTEKQKAINLASIRGVQEVVSDKLLVDWNVGDGMTRQKRYEALTDEKIAEYIRLGMSHHPLLLTEAEDISIEVNKAKVYLSGDVSRLSMKDAAGDVARNTIGVQGLRNRIAILWPDDKPSDKTITETSARALDRDAYLEHAELIPRTRNAHVHLYGSVDTEYEKRRAERIVSAQPGVVHVANYLTVLDGWDEQPDDEIKENILRELELLRTDPHVDVTVDVKNGVPIFSGHVATWLQWQGLLRIAEEAGGRRPHNNVTIHYRPQGISPGLYVPQ